MFAMKQVFEHWEREKNFVYFGIPMILAGWNITLLNVRRMSKIRIGNSDFPNRGFNHLQNCSACP